MPTLAHQLKQAIKWRNEWLHYGANHGPFSSDSRRGYDQILNDLNDRIVKLEKLKAIEDSSNA